ncbi:hypothetical protein ACIGXM_14380 [Kitasatospora sp. NPDC052896]|uniref:hypothetical protein n=1 Tax=Kitasatospora sp. NPDC052896 TaxID=3364061 RepID=UPI0037C78B81
MPSDVARLADAIDSFLKLILTSGSSSTTPAPTTGQNLLNVNGQVAGLTSTLATHTSQIAALQAQIAALQHVPYAYTAQYDPLISFNASQAGTAHLIQSLTIPPQNYQRLLIAYGTGTWNVEPDTIPGTNPPIANVVPLAMSLDMSTDGGATFANRAYSAVWSVDFTFSLVFMETIPANATNVIRQYVNCPEVYHFPSGSVIYNDDDDHPSNPTRIYAVTIPWSGAALPLPT